MYTYILSQVPDDLVDVLNDPTLFSNNGEITTKEILKRFGDRRVNGPSYGDVNDIVGQTRPQARRIETDPAGWPEERSVRPVQEPIAPYANSAQGTPPPKWRNPDDPHPSPYGQSFEASDASTGSADPNQRREWRNSGWSRQNSSVGITGTG